jgi:hypothetical protein
LIKRNPVTDKVLPGQQTREFIGNNAASSVRLTTDMPFFERAIQKAGIKKPGDARRAGLKRREIRKIAINNVQTGDWLTAWQKY